MNLDQAFLLKKKEEGLLQEDEYRDILKRCHEDQQSLLITFLDTELHNEKGLLEEVATSLGCSFIDLRSFSPQKEALARLPVSLAHFYLCFPLSLEGNHLEVALPNPVNQQALDDLRTVLGLQVSARLAGKRSLQDALKKHYGIGAETVDVLIRSQDESTDEMVNLETDLLKGDEEDEASIIKFVNQILREAIKERATDIHIEPYEKELKIRYRIDGILYDAPFPTTIKHFHQSIVSRIKIMARLNISERRLPQDGRFKVSLGNNQLDLRVSILPTPWGEATNIRVLSGAYQFLKLNDLGFEPEHLSRLEEVIQKPHGIILVTGPTGSGKTTTLYASLNRLNHRDRKIITIEDPIEYMIPSITQIQINPKINLTFARGLRSMLRHDPDVMMVGEIRDHETAEIAIQVAMTGHLVFSTLHTNDAASAISRLLDIGVERFLVASSVECVMAQRLVRLLCPHCKQRRHSSELTEQEIKYGLKESDEIFGPGGCEECKFTGYYGRSAIYEIILLNEEIKELVMTQASTRQIREAAKKAGTMFLRENGFIKVKRGETSLEEVYRVTADYI